MDAGSRSSPKISSLTCNAPTASVPKTPRGTAAALTEMVTVFSADLAVHSRLKENSTMNAKKLRRVGLYVRTSTDRQTTKNQQLELEAVAARHGWHVVAVYRDQRGAPWARQAVAGGIPQRDRHGRDMVGRSTEPIVAGSDRPVARIPHQGHRSLFAHARLGYVDAERQGDVLDARCVR